MRTHNYILFHDDGQFSEHHKITPEPVHLTDYLLWLTPSPSQWYQAAIMRGTNEINWAFVETEDVPGGIRLLALLFTQ